MSDDFDLYYSKLMRFCAYRERCTKEVKDKIYSLKIPEELHDRIIKSLIDDRFLDDLRFTEQYVLGKFRQKQWGRIKISYHLFQKNIPQNIVNHALNLIDEEDYKNTLNTLIEKHRTKIKSKNDFEHRQKVRRFLKSRGFEVDYLKNI